MLAASFLVLTFVWTGTAAGRGVPECNQSLFYTNVENCLMDFNKSMQSSGNEDPCPWPSVLHIYNHFKECVDKWAKVSRCAGRGLLVDKVFLEVHNNYFSHCGQIQDPPLFTLIMLIAPTVIATIFLPLLCQHLATWKKEMPGALGL